MRRLPEVRAARRGAVLIRVLVGLALFLLASAGVFYWLASRGFQTTDDAFVEGTLSYVAAEIPGRILEAAVAEHEVVKQGQTLIRLDPEQALARIARAEADLAEAHNQMAAAEAAAAAADAEGKAATVEAWRTNRELERTESLAQRGAASGRQLDAARAAHDAALARVRALEMRARAERAVLGSEAPIRQAEAALREARLELARTRLRAPFDAVVGRKNAEPGDIVRPGQPVLALTRIEPRWIEANFKETQIEGMRPGSPATVWIDAYPHSVFHGHVDSFSPASGAKYALIPPEPAVGNFTKVVQRLPVRIALDEVEDEAGRHPIDDARRDLPGLALGLSAVVTVDAR